MDPTAENALVQSGQADVVCVAALASDIVCLQTITHLAAKRM